MFEGSSRTVASGSLDGLSQTALQPDSLIGVFWGVFTGPPSRNGNWRAKESAGVCSFPLGYLIQDSANRGKLPIVVVVSGRSSVISLIVTAAVRVARSRAQRLPSPGAPMRSPRDGDYRCAADLYNVSM